MTTLYEPTIDNVERLTAQAGTFYLVVEEWKITAVRRLVYLAANDKDLNIHTHYDRVKRTLRVVLSEKEEATA